MRSALWVGVSFVLYLASACAVAAPRAEESPASDDATADDGGEDFYLGEGADGEVAGKATAGLVEPDFEPAQPVSAPREAPERTNEREVIYSAALRLVVVSASAALASIQTLATQAGGHLQESDSRSITIRVPSSSFDAVIERIAALGEVVERSIKASDVTEEMQDLGIRLENARKARERLLEHLAKSDKIADTLAIEQALARVTGEIEQMEGRQRYLQSQVAMSTIRVELNGATPQRPGGGLVPFEWIGRLGDGLLAGSVQSLPRKPRFLAHGPQFEPPPEFVRYYSSRDLVEAMDADGLRIKVQVQDNYDEGALAFWNRLARKALTEGRALAVTEERDLGDGRVLLAGTREVGDKLYGYLLVLSRTKRKVMTFEAWGPKELFDPRAAALLASALSLRF